ncbi:hypothetical protein [Flavobacterium sp.]|uniref:hypothetical protein n=1 Tax=Flavobacterium sp. TaxID=239 RepID=UPI0025BC45A2|nr:hypothetical protein [Flavobacterium sp.]
MSTTKKGSNRKIEISICAWTDLLGYGSMLFESQFDPTVDLSKKAIERLELFHSTASKHSHQRFNIYALNDGLICQRDISPRTRSVTCDFIKRVIKLHNDINLVDKEAGFFGARTIIAAGFRMRSESKIIVESGIKKVLLKQLEEGTLTPVEAIHMAMKARPYFGIVPELQANFAFTKAYLVDSEGTKGGFGGPNCYIDLSIFKNPLPDFITFSEYVNWNSNGLWGKFGKLEKFESNKAHLNKDMGFLSGFEIAENITKSPNAEKRIRNMSKSNR